MPSGRLVQWRWALHLACSSSNSNITGALSFLDLSVCSRCRVWYENISGIGVVLLWWNHGAMHYYYYYCTWVHTSYK